MAINVTTLTEEQVLKKLNIPDFRHITKDKIMTFFSTLSYMDPEVAKKAIEQFPEFAGTVKELIFEYRQILDKAFNDNTESVKSYYVFCYCILDSLSEILKQDNLTFEEKQYIIAQMLEIESRINKKDTENKKHTIKILGLATAFITFLGFALAAGIGVHTNVMPPDDSDDSDDSDDEYDDYK